MTASVRSRAQMGQSVRLVFLHQLTAAAAEWPLWCYHHISTTFSRQNRIQRMKQNNTIK